MLSNAYQPALGGGIKPRSNTRIPHFLENFNLKTVNSVSAGKDAEIRQSLVVTRSKFETSRGR